MLCHFSLCTCASIFFQLHECLLQALDLVQPSDLLAHVRPCTFKLYPLYLPGLSYWFPAVSFSTWHGTTFHLVDLLFKAAPNLQWWACLCRRTMNLLAVSPCIGAHSVWWKTWHSYGTLSTAWKWPFTFQRHTVYTSSFLLTSVGSGRSL